MEQKRELYKLILHVDAKINNDDVILENITPNELDNIYIVDKHFGTKDFNTYFFESAVDAIVRTKDKKYIVVIDKDWLTQKYGIWVFERVEQ